MGAVEIREGVYWVGVRDPELAVFDIVIPTEYGTTYNSYLLMGEKMTGLVDCVKYPFAGEWFENIKDVVPVEEIDFVVVNHSEPDHSGGIVKLLEVNPDVKVYLSKAAKGFMDNIVNGPYNCEVIQDGQELDMGGRKIRFIVAPFLHWPDTIFTYDEKSRILFPCDFLGAHFCTEKVFNDELEPDERERSVGAFRYYYNTIMRPYKDYILQACEKIKDLPIDIIAPSHGPVLRDDVESYVEWYKERASILARKGEGKRVAVIFASAYGNTAAMAKKVAEGLEKAGVTVKLINAVEVPMNEIIDEVELADGVIFGTSTLNATVPKPILNIISNMVVLNVRGKYFSVFGSYGWSGEAIKMVQDILLTMRLKLVGEPVRVRLTPSEEDLKKCEDLGRAFGSELLGK